MFEKGNLKSALLKQAFIRRIFFDELLLIFSLRTIPSSYDEYALSEGVYLKLSANCDAFCKITT
jgi:hypothetical protein